MQSMQAMAHFSTVWIVYRTTGTHTVGINFTALAQGQTLQVRTNFAGQAYVSNILTCGAPVVVPPPPNGNGNPGNNPPLQSPPAWSGYSDGRINPDPAEAYTVFCAYDRIFIHGDEPSQNQRIVAIVDIEGIMALATGGQYVLDDMTISRIGDTIVVQGTNGYYAPEFRTKTFNFSECLQRNADNGGSYDANGQPLYPSAPALNGRPPVVVAFICSPQSTRPQCAGSGNSGSNSGDSRSLFPLRTVRECL